MTAAGKLREAKHVRALVETVMAVAPLSRTTRALTGACTLLVLLALLTTATPSAMADARYAALSLDANTGQVLLAEHADEARYPASLTKVMTLYLVFEQMQLGRLRADTLLPISVEAASVPPSRLGLKPGSAIAVSDAIKALITKSANDVAVAFAEHIAGSEERFAQLMTQKAREFGMRATTFRNASGLPDPEQTTTARDMVTLALRLYDAFPREARLFSLQTFQYAGRNHRNHNTMLANFAGMDGIKTGYTRASGFNLLASVRRDGRHVIAVVLGGKTATARNARMRLILGRTLQQASTERTRQRLVIAARRVPQPAPAVRSASAPARIASRVGAADVPPPRLAEPVAAAAHNRSQQSSSSQDGGRWRSQVRLAAPIGADVSVASRVGANSGWQPTVAPDSRAARRPSTLQAQASYLASASPFTSDGVGRERQGQRGRAEIQIGAFANPGEARDRLAAARQLAPQLLGDASEAVPMVTVGGRTFHRARFVGLDASTAASACADLRRRQIDCLVTRSR